MTTPRWARALLSAIAPRARRTDILGDLEEVHRRRREARGPVAAWLATSLEALPLAVALVVYRVRETRWWTRSTRARPGGSRLLSSTDLVLALRLIRKQPVLAGTMVLALAIGIGTATAGYTFMDAVAHGKLPFPDGDRFVRLNAFGYPDGQRISFDVERYESLRHDAADFAFVGAFRGDHVNVLHASSEVESVVGAFVTPGAFNFLPYQPVAGRILGPHDGERGAPPVVLLRESLWERRYARDPSIIGRVLNVTGVERIVVGVAPNEFEFPNSAEIWLPLGYDEVARNQTIAGAVFGVLAEGSTLAAAAEHVQLLSARHDDVRPEGRVGHVTVTPFTDLSATGISKVLGVAVAMLVLVLMLVAANVANLVAARTAARQTELAVRTALGASRGRLVAQLFTEVLVLGTFAAALGLLASHVALGFVQRGIDVDEFPFWIDLAPSSSTVGFVVFATLLAAAIAGAVPGFKATRKDPARRIGSRGSSDARFGRVASVMIVTEMALSVGLLSAAAVLAWGFARHSSVDADLPRGQVLTASVYVDTSSDRSSGTDTPTALVAALREIPGVTAAGAATSLPRMSPAIMPVEVESSQQESGASLSTPVVGVDIGFFTAIGSGVTRGRAFRQMDFDPGATPVAIVNEAFVAKFMSGASPLGRRVRVSPGSGDASPWREVVGVVPDLGLVVGDPQLAAGYYVPIQQPELFYVVAQTATDPLTLAQPLRRAIFRVDPEIAVNDVVPLESVGWKDRAAIRTLSTVLTGIGGVALMLALAGMYAILSFTVTQRTREIGIRIALGAQRPAILWSVVARAAVLLGLGAAVGAGLGKLLIGIRGSILVMQLPDPGAWVFPAVTVVMAVAGIFACWIPARRALRITPVEALQQE